MRRGSGGRRVVVALASLAAALVVGTLVAATPASAHSPHDTIIDLAVSPTFATDHTLFTISRERLLKSTDGGATWRSLARGLDTKGAFSAVSQVRDQPDTLYVATRGSGAYRSDDGGLTWSPRIGGIEYHTDLAWLEASPSDPDLVFAQEGWGGALFRTGDGGTTWTPTGLAAASVAFAPDDDRFVAVADSTGAVRTSTDAGVTWGTPVQLAKPGSGLKGLAVGPAAAGGQRDVRVGSGTEGAWVSHDSGMTFEPVALPYRVQSIALSPTYAEDGRWWASTWGDGVCRAVGDGAPDCETDGLRTDPQADQLDEAGFGRVAVPADGDGRTVFVGTFTGLDRSRDGGRSWREIQTQKSTAVSAVSTARSPSGPATVVVTSYLNGAARSTVTGSRWTPVDRGLATRAQWVHSPTYVARLISVIASPDYEHDRTLFASNRVLLQRSTDAGRTWTDITPPGILNKADNPPDYFWITPSPTFDRDRTILLGTNRGKSFRSTDGGSTWERTKDFGAPVTTMAISGDFADDGTAFATTAKQLFRTTDAGRTWKAVPGAPAGVVSLSASPAFGTDRTIFAGTPNGLAVSRDGGETWGLVAVGDAPLLAPVESVVPSPAFGDDGTVLVSMRGRGLYRSTDSGRTFVAIAPELLADQVVFTNWYHPTTEPIVFSPDFATDQTVFGYADEHLYRSTDAGDTWTEVERPVQRHSTRPEASPVELIVPPSAGGSGGHAHDGTGSAPNASPTAGRVTASASTSSSPSRRVLAGTALAVVVVAGGAVLVRRRLHRADPPR